MSIDYLLGRHDVPAQTRSQKQRIDPKSLPVYHGNPVWLSDPTQHIEEWAFVDGVGRKLRLFSGDALELDAFAGDAFAYKPSFSVITNSRPLELEELRTMSKVWVEPISSDALANKELRGWYLVKIKYVENEIQTRFHFWNYSSKWLAFETEQY